jgi:hypothetical protein
MLRSGRDTQMINNKRSIKHSGFEHAAMRTNPDFSKHCPKCGRKVQRKGLCSSCRLDKRREKRDARLFKKDMTSYIKDLKPK